ncbi:carbohydrate sulfotransferase 3-like [Patiria miniata]|uniref:Sulfotransferase domain-containing protein n=1 Tax=Patiria miniata TaxID=46514 RepID=A0A914BQ11_PATMI|nr:carbohydrate sulfotransferase 3-like [Patiria miniata]
MARNIRCVLFGLVAVSAICLLLYGRRSGTLVKSVTAVSREGVRQITQDKSNTQEELGIFSRGTNVSSEESSSCPPCNRNPTSIDPVPNGVEEQPVVGDDSVPAEDTRSSDPPGSRIVVLTSMRTGSSFIGEIFGRNDDIFYLFEPGLALLTELHSRGALFLQPMYIDMLRSLYQCNTSSLDFYIKWLSRQPPLEVKKKVPRIFDSLCYPFETGRTGLKCDAIPAEIFERKCQEKRHIAIKSIRIWDIGMFLSLIQDSNVKLKVIHLVRDPRGMTASRVLAMNVVENTFNKLQADSFTDEMRSYLMEFCSYSIDNKEIGYYLPKYRDNYLLLRYEDMSLDPERVTQLIYNFTGLGAVPETISKWIAENTQAHRPGVYSTTRVSSQVYQSWRTKLDYKTAKAIENVGRCAEMMEHFGYLPVRDESHLKNLSSPLLAPIPPPRDSYRYQP